MEILEKRQKTKIDTATELLNIAKDYVELLRVAPKLKKTFNVDVINNQIELNKKEIKDYANRL